MSVATVEVLFFGVTADIVGSRSVIRSIDPEERSPSFFENLLNEYPRLRAHKLYFSINQEFATGTEILAAGDEVAVFTAVSGG